MAGVEVRIEERGSLVLWRKSTVRNLREYEGWSTYEVEVSQERGSKVKGSDSAGLSYGLEARLCGGNEDVQRATPQDWVEGLETSKQMPGYSSLQMTFRVGISYACLAIQ